VVSGPGRIVEALNGFLTTQKHMTLKDECGLIMLVNFIRHVFWSLLVDTTTPCLKKTEPTDFLLVDC